MHTRKESEISLRTDGWLLRQAQETVRTVSDWPKAHRRNVDFQEYIRRQDEAEKGEPQLKSGGRE
jgi:hypothetical protein